MGVNKVQLANGETIVDMTGANITSDAVMAGYVGYGADGEPVVGTLVPTMHKTLSVTLRAGRWVDNMQSVDVDFATTDAMVIAGGAPGDQEYLDCDVWCSGQDDGLLTFSCTYEPSEDVIANIGLLTNGTLVITYATGSAISLNDSAQRKLRGLTLYGKTTQNGTPTPDAPVPLESAGDGGSIGVTVAGKNLMQNTAETKATNGITFTVNDDGSVTANGTATATAFFNINTTLKLSEGTKYILSGCPSYTGVLIAGGNYGSDSGNGMTFTALSTAASALSPAVYLRIASGTTVNNIVFKPMLRLASVADNTYEPYKGQALTVSTPNGLPGIPVTSGGNYTDENGQQWICDEVDFARGKYVQRCGVKVFDGSSDEPWGTGGTNQSGVYRLRCNPSFFGNAIKPAEKNNTAANIMASNYPVVSAEATYKRQIGICIDTVGEVWLYDSRFTTSDKTGFLSYLAANPMRLVYELATPIETDLTAEQISAYAALRSNSPTTTITTDSGAGMLVRYVKE